MHQTKSLPWHYQGETLVIETPEQIRIEFRIAPYGSRMLAALIDRAIITALLLVLVFGAIMIAPSLDGESSGFLFALLLGAYFLLSQFYFVIAELRGEGRTFGKRQLGLRTVHETGRGIDVSTSLIRNLARIVDEMPPAWLVPALVKGRRRIGDMLAGTFVITEVKEAPKAKTWIDELAQSYANLEEKLFRLPPTATSKLVEDDLNLIEYLGDRVELAQGFRRRKMLREIASRYVKRLGLEDRASEIDAAPERFLQELGLQLRQQFDRIER